MASDAPMHDGFDDSGGGFEDNGGNGGDDALNQLAEQYGGPDELIAALGYEFADDEPEAHQSPYVTREEFEQDQAAGQQQPFDEAFIDQLDQHLGSGIEQINATLKEQGRRELTPQQERLIVQAALVNTADGQMPDVHATYEDFAGPPEAPDVVNMSRRELVEYAAQRLAELPEPS